MNNEDMKAGSNVFKKDGEILRFFCPGCKNVHTIKTSIWEFNGDLVNPTVSPSILCNPGTKAICHSFVENGKIRFLGDCYHELKNKTVKLSPWDWEEIYNDIEF